VKSGRVGGARCTAESSPVPVASRRSPGERVDVVGGQVGAEPQEAQRVPVPAGLEGAVGGHFGARCTAESPPVPVSAPNSAVLTGGQP
jgi:hypothetical protein